jgi:putative FmdB family regulatory protein
MPLYEYECETCGHRFEVIQKFSDRPVETCPKCGGAVRKLLSSPAIQFKGSGWYITDYARKDSAKPESAKSETTKADTSKSESSTKESTAKPTTPAAPGDSKS